MMRNCVISIEKLGFPFKTLDPFLFCVYHKDEYPSSATKLRRGSGADFDFTSDYRMYHGEDIPGFPQHPHRGFETVTATLEGYVDHTDSLGSAGRYGMGDNQWMTAGAGVVHGEVFPMIHDDKPNTLRLFQIWLNLPSKSKMVPPTYVMHWHENIPRFTTDDGLATVVLWAGREKGLVGLPPPPNSWATDENNEVAIWHMTLKPGGRYQIPRADRGKDINRRLFYVEGSALTVGEQSIAEHCAITLDADVDAIVTNPVASSTSTELLLLQGRPIGEPISQQGPFVMNTAQEIQQAFRDYQSTHFGGWPWPDDAMTFPKDKGRFALLNGQEEFPPSSM
jgi:redox-sensitive bicupin YhaK (pirin superfamily)